MKDRNTALEQILHVLDISEDDFGTISIIEGLLDRSIGTDSLQEAVYRPNYVIAVQLWLDVTNNLVKGEGATFDQNFETTRRYLNIQKLQDTGLEILEEYQSDTLLAVVTDSDGTKPEKPITIGFMSF